MKLSRILLSIIVFSCSFQTAFSQAITQDGSYVGVVIDKTLDNSAPVLVLQSTGKKTWKREIAGASQAVFTADDKHALYNMGDTLFIHRLGSDKRQCLTGVASYQQPNSGAGKWLACRVKDNKGKVLLHDIHTGKQNQYETIQDYFFDENGDKLFLKSQAGRENALDVVILSSGHRLRLWKGTGEPFSYVFDKSNAQLAFFVKDNLDPEKPQYAIWHYRTGNQQATMLVDNSHAGIDSNLVIGGVAPVFPGLACTFSPKGSKLFFYLQEKELPVKDPSKPKVDVWSYLDSRNMDVQLLEHDVLRNYAAVVDVESNKLIRLEQDGQIIAEGDKYQTFFAPNVVTDDHVVICDFGGDFIFHSPFEDAGFFSQRIARSFDEYNWNSTNTCSIFLVSLHDGSKHLLKDDVRIMASEVYGSLPYIEFSPDGETLVYFDAVSDGYYSYNVNTGNWVSLTHGVQTSWYEGNLRLRKSESCYIQASAICWDTSGLFFLVRDQKNDIWKIDPTGNIPAHNTTIGFSNNKDYRHSELDYQSGLSGDFLFQVRGISRSNQYENPGYFLLTGAKSDYQTLIPFGGDFKYKIIRQSKNAKVYLVSRQNRSTPESFLITRDFKAFSSISSSSEEKRLENGADTASSRLLTWTSFDGQVNQGVLVLPPDFDPTKKYPVVISYYDARGFQLRGFNDFRPKRVTESDGYIYFYPDVHFAVGSTCDCVYNSVVSGAEHIAKFPYVDKMKMGIMGVSFGGYTTNCLVTRTDMFAAAASAVGYSNMLSSYLGIDVGARRGASVAENGQNAIGVTPWERLDLYIENSPALLAHRVNTPLLLVVGEKDTSVPYMQGVDMFKAMRRLGKRVWLFTYDEADHGDPYVPWRPFFDHYLKGEAPARWMVETIPARQKGRADMFDLVEGAETPGPGLLSDTIIRTPAQQKLVDEKPITYKLP